MTSYIIAYSYYEKYVGNLLNQTNRIYKNSGASKVVFVSVGDLDLAALFKNISKIECDAINLRHNNDSWEFGGYQVGLDYIRKVLKKSDSIYILNDTAGVHSFLPAWIIGRFTKITSILSGLEVPSAVGELDGHKAEMDLRVLGRDANSWIRSCAFSLNYAALEAISWKLSHTEFLGEISKKSEKALSLSHLANSALELRINRWLFNENPEYRWPSSIGYVSNENYSLIRNKALSILNEKVLSATINENRGRLENFVPKGFFLYNLYRIERRFWAYKNSGEKSFWR